MVYRNAYLYIFVPHKGKRGQLLAIAAIAAGLSNKTVLWSMLSLTYSESLMVLRPYSDKV